MKTLIPIVSIVGDKVVANSRDVAAFFGKQHGHVLRDIDALRAQMPEGGVSKFGEGVYTMPETGPQQHRCIVMDRDGFTLLVMGFQGKAALDFKLKYIEAFNQMEAKIRAQPAFDPSIILNDPAAMRGILLHHVEKRIEAEAKVAELTPKAAALDRIADATGTFTLRDAAKILGQRPGDFVKALIKQKWVFRQNGAGRLVPHQDRLNAGLIDFKVHLQDVNGEPRARQQAVITPKGMTALAERLGAGRQLGFDLC